MGESGHAIDQSDEQILQRIFAILSAAGLRASPYSWDGDYAKQVRQLPSGLRAMAATHHLDVSLTLDDLEWHFFNFGEPNHVFETEAGLMELGLDTLADLFHQAYELVSPYLPTRGDGQEVYESLECDGKLEQLEESLRILERNSPKLSGSVIYAAWVRYARRHPELLMTSSSSNE
jgi:hypothetical protein